MQNKKLSGQPIICQLLSLIPTEIFTESVQKHQSDKYYKTLTTYKQFVFMLFGVISKNSSLTSLCKCLLFLEGKLTYVGITHLPPKSTLSDANINRKSDVFQDIYYGLLNQYKDILSKGVYVGTLHKEVDGQKIKRFDSTTISLFSEIFKGAGRKPEDGKKAGGVKLQTLLALDCLVPEHIELGAAAKNDKDFLGQLAVKKDHLYVFDKGYVNYSIYDKWTKDGVFFVTRINKNASYKVLTTIIGDSDDVLTQQGIMSEKTISVKLKGQKNTLELRLVTYKDPETGKVLEFITNHKEYSPLAIAYIYKCRWDIEVFFKQLKQNYQLEHFFSDSQEGIKTQIWIALIANLLFTVIYQQTKQAEDFTTIVNIARQGICSYICLITIVKEKKLTVSERDNGKVQLDLFEIQQGVFLKIVINPPN